MPSKNPKTERQMFRAKAEKVAKVGTAAAMADHAARFHAAAATRDKVTRAEVEQMIDEAFSHPFSTWFRHWRRRVEAKKAKMEAARVAMVSSEVSENTAKYLEMSDTKAPA